MLFVYNLNYVHSCSITYSRFKRYCDGFQNAHALGRNKRQVADPITEVVQYTMNKHYKHEGAQKLVIKLHGYKKGAETC
jgi:hypothetical protein